MATTPWSEINDIFFSKIEADRAFFNYINLDDEESYNIAVERATSCLKEAIARLSFECGSEDVDFWDCNIEKREFNFELTPNEKYLLASLQYESYMARDISKLKVFSLNFTPSDLTVFDPSNSRRTFMQMYESVKQENLRLLDNYKSRSRSTNLQKQIDYASYSDV